MAQSRNFQLGYFVAGQVNKPFYIVDQSTIPQFAYGTGEWKIRLWVDPHV